MKEPPHQFPGPPRKFLGGGQPWHRSVITVIIQSETQPALFMRSAPYSSLPGRNPPATAILIPRQITRSDLANMAVCRVGYPLLLNFVLLSVDFPRCQSSVLWTSTDQPRGRLRTSAFCRRTRQQLSDRSLTTRLSFSLECGVAPPFGSSYTPGAWRTTSAAVLPSQSLYAPFAESKKKCPRTRISNLSCAEAFMGIPIASPCQFCLHPVGYYAAGKP